MEKTNVMRVLDQKKIPYTPYHVELSEAVSGVEMATLMNKAPEVVFKTLVTVGSPNKYYVFVIPSLAELNLKKAAKTVGEKKIEMIKSKDLLPLTGYVHGGCSPIGMKKFFPTTIHHTAENLPEIVFSAGKIGYQVELKPEDLKKVIRFQFADLCD